MNPEYLEALWSVFLTFACFMAAASDVLTPNTIPGSTDNTGNCVVIYDELLRVNPDHEQWHAMRGMTLLSSNDYQRAIDDFDTLIRLEPDVAAYHLLRAIAYSNLGRIDEAIASYGDAIQLAPHESSGYLLRAISRAKQRDFKNAIADLDEVIRRNPDDASHLVTRGQLYLASGQYEGAWADARKAIRIDPNQKSGLILHGYLSLHYSDVDTGLLDCNLILQLDPRNAEIHRSRAWIYFSQQEYGLALTEILDLVEIDCRQLQIDSVEDFARRCMTHADAILKSPDIVSADPKQIAVALLDRGRARMTLGLSDTISDLDAAIRLDPELIQAYAIRGQAWLDLGETRRAIDDFNVVLRKQPNDAQAWAGRGMAYAAIQDWRQACDDFTAALSRDPDMKRVKARRGIAWQKLEEWQHAIDDFKDVTKGPAFHVRDMARLDEVKKPAPAPTPEVKEKPKPSGTTWNPFADPTNQPKTTLTTEAGTASLWADLIKPAKDGTTNSPKTAATNQTGSLNYPVKFDPLYIDAFLRLGECYEAQNQWDKALETYNRLAATVPEESRVYRRLAWVLGTCPDDRLRSAEQAIGYAWKAKECKHGYDDIENLTVLAAVYSEIGDFERAIEFQQQAREIVAARADKDFEQRNEILIGFAFQRSLDDVDRIAVTEQRRAIKTAIKECEQSNWTSVTAIERLADAYANAGELEAAQNCQASAQTMKTRDKDKPLTDRLARYRTGITFHDQGPLR